MAQLEDLKIRRISLMTFPEVMEHIKEVRFRRRTEPKKSRLPKSQDPKVRPIEAIIRNMSLEDIQKFLRMKGKNQ